MEARAWHQHYDPGVSPSLDYEELTLPQIFDRTASRHPDLPALVFQNFSMSYGRLKAAVDRLATGLAAQGVRQDSRVAIHLPNLPQTVIATQAVLALGAHAVMTNPLYVARELEHQWGDSGCEVAITADYLYADRLAPIRDRLPVKTYIVASIPEYLRFPLKQLAPLKLKRMDPPAWARVEPAEGVHFFRKFLESYPAEPPRVEIGMDAAAFIQYTGGTTGVSKGAVLTHRNMSFNIQQCAAWFTGLERGKETWLAVLPYFHIFGLNTAMQMPILEAGRMVLMPNPRDLPGVIKNIEKHKVTVLNAVPAMFNAINHFPGVENRDLASVKACFSGSAPLPVDVLERFEALTGARIAEGFGLTETSPVTHVNPVQGKRKIGFIGLPVSDTDARVVDANTGKNEMPLGEEGELILKGPQIMQGYLGRPEATAEAIRDGWLRTGDLAVMDEDGFFKIVGRKKDMIIAGGYNIYPDEIDNVLVSHPSVLEACTIGIPDPKRGETTKSFVVLQPGEHATEEELRAWCKERLAAYKVPRSVVFRDDLPKSAMMKLLRRVLREEELAGAR